MKVGYWSFAPGTRDSDVIDQVIDIYSNRVLLSSGYSNRWGADGKLTTRLVGLDELRYGEQLRDLMTK